MSTINFDTERSKQIGKLEKENPLATIEEYEQYLKEYESDYITRIYYILSLLKTAQLDAAKDEIRFLDDIIRYSDYAPNLKNDSNRLNRLINQLAQCKFKLLCCQGKYKEALSYYNQNEQKLIGNIYSEALFFLNSRTGNIDPTRREPNTYLYRQIVEYQEDDFMRNILDKQSGKTNDENDDFFFPWFPIEPVITEVKNHLTDQGKLHLHHIDDTWIFKCNDCGTNHNRPVDFFKVSTFHYTKDIFTMTPVFGFTQYPGAIDLTEKVKKFGTFGDN